MYEEQDTKWERVTDRGNKRPYSNRSHNKKGKEVCLEGREDTREEGEIRIDGEDKITVHQEEEKNLGSNSNASLTKGVTPLLGDQRDSTKDLTDGEDKIMTQEGATEATEENALVRDTADTEAPAMEKKVAPRKPLFSGNVGVHTKKFTQVLMSPRVNV
ncbi:uncharacterized protein LOC125602574 [Brassica napus]|uniref:uncharacterized protein LOC125602574 n=1 Tax=Brassica napus TaxID=3708 RepID=UPI0020785169|nr:uncharacterized protein LOC125602574 [Brassica napus]